MNRKQRQLLLVASACLGGMLLFVQQSPGVERFTEHARQAGEAGRSFAFADPFKALTRQVWREDAGDTRSQALAYLRAEAEKRNVPAVNAKIDPVWKALPGYNGIEVDIDRSLAAAEAQSFRQPLPIVLREVPPQIGLDQLGPHPIYKGNPHKRMVGLMINVAWGDEYITPMLNTLEKEGVRATFFLDGKWLSKNVETAKKIAERGHELGNHAYSHKNMSKLSREQNTAEITKTEQLLKEAGVTNKLFAPPSGDFNQTTVEVAHELKLRTILWTLDTIDWKKPEPASIVRKVTTRVEPGSLILMHPTSSSSEALAGMIHAIKSKGLRLGTVSEVISADRIPEVESKGQ
ncbi:polysaccharide deacetylase family protein [Paenibacillus validus]|uniref:Polysaccharide deacetylase family protein n=1 Tax=Paenibacillus validus TaxID=44253 RepID=A0A7X3CRQ2_9BACL|nr:polysaccharide deacetylase family protein [Paenibacillus validus]MUG70477.1 polysaccharide deacetylase family protein [Paenibacillus validus]